MPKNVAYSPVKPLALLTLTTLLCIAIYLTVDVVGSWSYVLERRLAAVSAMLIVGWAVGMATVLFQTVTENRILTPAIMGFDALYLLLQTTLAFTVGAAVMVRMESTTRFLLEAGIMIIFAVLLYGWLLVKVQRSVHLLVLVGIVFGVLFRSGSSLMQRLIDPGEFQVLQDRFFASFNRVDDSLLLISFLIVSVASAFAWRLLPALDVLTLGRETATSLGVNYQRLVIQTLIIVAILIAVATALVGPTLFFGLLVAHVAYLLFRTHKHRVLIPAAALVGAVTLVGGQALLERVLHYDTALSIIIEFVGGILFIVLLLTGART